MHLRYLIIAFINKNHNNYTVDRKFVFIIKGSWNNPAESRLFALTHNLIWIMPT